VHINGTILLPLSWRPGRPPRRTAADYYRRPERFTNEYRQHNVQQTQRASAQYQSGTDVVRQLTRTREEVIGRLEIEDLRRVVDIANVGAMTVQDIVATRVLAVTAHAIDVAITLERTQPRRSARSRCALRSSLTSSAAHHQPRSTRPQQTSSREPPDEVPSTRATPNCSAQRRPASRSSTNAVTARGADPAPDEHRRRARSSPGVRDRVAVGVSSSSTECPLRAPCTSDAAATEHPPHGANSERPWS
jgi:hypothetical protein